MMQCGYFEEEKVKENLILNNRREIDLFLKTIKKVRFFKMTKPNEEILYFCDDVSELSVLLANKKYCLRSEFFEDIFTPTISMKMEDFKQYFNNSKFSHRYVKNIVILGGIHSVEITVQT